MATSTLRIDPTTQARLRDLAHRRGESMREVVARAVEELWREQLLEEINASFARLREDPEAWAQELEERRLSENTLMDDLGDDEWVE